MITTVFGHLLTSVGTELAGVPLAALAPFLWNAALLIGVRQAIRARDRRLQSVTGVTAGYDETGEFRSAA